MSEFKASMGYVARSSLTSKTYKTKQSSFIIQSQFLWVRVQREFPSQAFLSIFSNHPAGSWDGHMCMIFGICFQWPIDHYKVKFPAKKSLPKFWLVDWLEWGSKGLEQVCISGQKHWASSPGRYSSMVSVRCWVHNKGLSDGLNVIVTL